MGDWSSATYVISQVFVILAYCTIICTYFVKKRSAVLLLAMTNNILLITSFSLLSAWVGVGMCFVGLCRDIIQTIVNRNRSEEDKKRILKQDWYFLAVLLTILTTITIFTQDGFWTLFAFFAAITFTISIWQKSILVYKILGAVCSTFWITYYLNIENFFGIILESCLMFGIITGIILHYIKVQKTLKPKIIG